MDIPLFNSEWTKCHTVSTNVLNEVNDFVLVWLYVSVCVQVFVVFVCDVCLIMYVWKRL